DDDRRRCRRQGGYDAAENPGGAEAHEGGHIDADGPRGGFGNGDHVQQLVGGDPAVFGNQGLQEGQGRQPAADGEQADFEKLVNQQEVDHALSTREPSASGTSSRDSSGLAALTFNHCPCPMPIRAAAAITKIGEISMKKIAARAAANRTTPSQSLTAVRHMLTTAPMMRAVTAMRTPAKACCMTASCSKW